MLPKSHIILGAIFSLILVHFFNFSLIAGGIIFLSSVLIDVDHYLYYVYKKKDWSLRRAYGFFIENERKLLSCPRQKRNKIAVPLCPFHGIEFVLILLFLGIFLWKYLFFVTFGFFFHLFIDIIYQTTYWDRLDRISIAYDWIKYKKLGVKGSDY